MTLTLSKHTAKIFTASGLTDVEPTSLDMTIDEGWSPYIQGSFTVPSANFTEALDPRAGARVTVRLHQAFGELVEMAQLTQQFGGSVKAVTTAYAPNVSPRKITRDFSRPWNTFSAAQPISYITASYGGSVASMTTAFGGKDVSAITKFMHPGDPAFNPQPSTVFEANLGVRSINRDYNRGTTTVRVASDEILLQDYAHTSATPYTPATTDVRTLVSYVLSLIGATLYTGTATGTFDSTVKWIAGQSAWSFINPIVQKAGLALYCDENRRWQLVTTAATSGSLALDDTSNITELTASLDRATDWFDAAVIEYNWNDGTASNKAYDIYAPSGYTKVKKISYDNTPYPGAGAAQALTLRAKTRGFKYQVDAVSNYNARPRQTLTVDVTGEPIKSAITSSIRWSQPDDRMSITMRDLNDI